MVLYCNFLCLCRVRGCCVWVLHESSLSQRWEYYRWWVLSMWLLQPPLQVCVCLLEDVCINWSVHVFNELTSVCVDRKWPCVCVDRNWPSVCVDRDWPSVCVAAGGMCPFRHISGEKTVVCKHWLRGLCKKGDQCEFLHEYDMTKMPECYFYSKFGMSLGVYFTFYWTRQVR